MTSEEAKARDSLQSDIYTEVRIAAEAHRQAGVLLCGIKYCNTVENVKGATI